jgi:2-aminoadipate transaminase
VENAPDRRKIDQMTRIFADRMSCVRKSFVREILKVTEDKEVISFADGLPKPRCFPVQEISAAAEKVLSECGEAALQYATSEGYLPLR